MGLFLMRMYSICDPRSPKQPQGGPGHLANAQRPRQHPTKKRGISKQGTYLATQAKKQLEHSPRDSRQPKGRRGQGGGLWSPPHLEFPRSPHRGRHGLNLMRGAHQGPCSAFRGAGSRAQQRSNVKRGKRGREKKSLVLVPGSEQVAWHQACTPVPQEMAQPLPRNSSKLASATTHE